MRGSIDRMLTEMDVLIGLNAQIINVINQIRVAVAHGRDNPIVVEDDEEGEVEVVERGNDMGEGLLREIVEDPAPPYEGQDGDRTILQAESVRNAAPGKSLVLPTLLFFLLVFNLVCHHMLFTIMTL